MKCFGVAYLLLSKPQSGLKVDVEPKGPLQMHQSQEGRRKGKVGMDWRREEEGGRRRDERRKNVRQEEGLR